MRNPNDIYKSNKISAPLPSQEGHGEHKRMTENRLLE